VWNAFDAFMFISVFFRGAFRQINFGSLKLQACGMQQLVE
jgi:hypothetical protein